MELSTEFHFSLGSHEIIAEGLVAEHHTELELTALSDLVLILHVRMHVTKEQLLVASIRKSDTHTLIRSISLRP